MKPIGCAVVLAAVLGIPSVALSQAYPQRSIRVVVSFPPGGSTDFTARLLAQYMPAGLGQNLIVDNRGGAAGNIGTDIVAKAAPDGYTLLVTADPPVSIAPSIYPKLPYDPVRDIPAITEMINYPYVAVVNAAVPVASLKELIALAKAQPGKVRYAHPGVGTGIHLAGELFRMTAGVDFISVPYKGGGPAMVAVVGNEAQVSFATPPSSLPHVKSGRLKALAQTTSKRSAPLPDLPTFAEAGVPKFHVDGWVGLFAPAGTPPRIIERLYAETVKVLRMPEVKEHVLAGGSEISGISTEEARAKIRREIAMWAKVVKAAGIKIE
ncbi:MAG TPA: tripartite tricarboxylate transporter substrate binding protein [Burkholderiales bacterium]|nr:tripartite tricarboxylate transporter substrate binding protein [Burkholderiales bacterium]